MAIDLEKYAAIKKLSPVAYDFLMNNIQKVAAGRHELGHGLYANIESYESKLRSFGKYEAHRRYIDIQFIIEGEELITLAPLRQVEDQVIQEYDSERDISFYERDDNGVDHYLQAGDFLIIGPETAHMPQICVNSQQLVRKCVVKVPV